MVGLVQMTALKPSLASDNTSASKTTAVTANEAQDLPVLETVVVTARKRNEDEQTTPIAISALTQEDLKNIQSDTIQDIAPRLPNLQIFKQASVGDVASIYLRGFGAATVDPSVDPPVAIYVDGIYIPQASGTLLDTFDLSEVEVDRGPQGTLLGKNSPVGAILVTTRKPTGTFGIDSQLDFGSYNYFGFRARMDVPVVQDVLAASISVMTETGGNYTYNYSTNKHDMGGVQKQLVRAALEYTPNQRFDWVVKASGVFNRDPQNADRDGSTLQSFPPIAPFIPDSCLIYDHCTPDPFWTTRAEQTTHNHSNSAFISSTMNYQFQPVTLTLVNGFMGFWSNRNNDIDGEPEIILEEKNAKTGWTAASEEFRISSNTGGGLDLGGRLDWLVGAYFFNETFRQDQNLVALDVFCPGGCPSISGQKGKDKSQAVFAHAIYKVLEDVSLSFGIRHTWDEKDHSYYLDPSVSFITDQPASWSNTSVEVGAQYQLDSDKMLYFRFAQGYRGGGFIGIPASQDTAGTFAPETNNTFEIGAKTDWFDHRLRVNLTAFRGTYSDLQKNVYIPNPLSVINFVSVTRNVASATVQGIEAQISALPVPQLNVGINLGFLDPKYDSYFADIVGGGVPMQLADSQRFGFSPHFSADLNATYTYDMGSSGSLTLNGDYNYRTHQYLADVTTLAAYQGAYGISNAYVEWQSDSGAYSLKFYGKNIFNTKYLVDIAPIALLTVLVDGAPATWGVTLSANF